MFIDEKPIKFELTNLVVMVYKFKIITQESPQFCLEVALDQDHTFFDLHSIIQKSVGFESHQLASFFVPDRRGKKLVEISMLDMGVNGGAFFIMQKTTLGDILNQCGQQLIYTFDLLNDRSFLIELTEIVMETNLHEPTVTKKKGEAPEQVLGGTTALQEQLNSMQNDEVYMDFGELEDYTEIFGEMEEF